MADANALIQSVSDLLDVLVELYVGSLIGPVLQLHDDFQAQIQLIVRNIVDSNLSRVPEWLTPSMIANARAVLVFPTILLLSWGQYLIPSILVLAVEFMGLLDAVLVKVGVTIKRELVEDAIKEDNRPTSIAHMASDDEDSLDNCEFEVVTTGSPQRMKSWSLAHRQKSSFAFWGIAYDKAFIVPCWIFLLSTVLSGGHRSVKFLTLWWLIVSEVTICCIHFKAFYSNGGIHAPHLEGVIFPSGLASDEKICTLKRSLEFLGTSLFILPYLRFLGVIFLLLACPLAYASYRKQSKMRVIYVVYTSSEKFDHKIIKFWSQAKALGSKLVVGVVGKNQADMVLNACATMCVDEVVAEAPIKADLMFLERQRIDYVVFMPNQTGLVTDEVISAGNCLVLSDDQAVRPMKQKLDSKKA